jgi:hypothetical protein
MSVKVATWTAGILALGWLGTAVAGLVLPSGHPPAAFVFGEGMALASYLIAPVGVGAASLDLWRARRRGTGAPPLAVALLGVNAVSVGGCRLGIVDLVGGHSAVMARAYSRAG